MPFMGLLSAGIGAGGSLLSGLFGSKGAKAAAKQQAAADQAGIAQTQGAVRDAQSSIGDTTAAAQGILGSNLGPAKDLIAQGTNAGVSTLRDAQQRELAMLLPYQQTGTAALSSLQDLAGPNGPLTNKFSFNPTDLQNDPGYKFTLQQGQDAIARSAAAQGGLFSGGTLKSLAGYTTGTANQYFNDAYQRSLSTFNTNQQQALNRVGTLQGLAGLGYGATGTGVGAIGSTAGQQANLQYGGGSQEGQLQFNTGTQQAGYQMQGGLAGAQAELTGAGMINQLLQSKGNVQAAGTMGSTNQWLNALQGGTNAVTGYLTQRYPGGTPGVAPNINIPAAPYPSTPPFIPSSSYMGDSLY